ncbi:hypothetical protein CSIM01_04704 [Colletotrichum simmondsii]|uniref:Uncharacterized protein n=1 Tax=Colletotrichum simmondsii TaxID=703756 RepID=A0A135TUC6_9PEZI|nr:hypothetical protein CSIM01_04704 [Colletotrichum simmondsii]
MTSSTPPEPPGLQEDHPRVPSRTQMFYLANGGFEYTYRKKNQATMYGVAQMLRFEVATCLNVLGGPHDPTLAKPNSQLKDDLPRPTPIRTPHSVGAAETRASSSLEASYFSPFARYCQSSIQVLSKQEVLATGVAIGASSRTDPVVVDENPPHLIVNLQQARHQGCRVVWASPNKHGSRPNRCRLAVLAPGPSPGSLGRCRPAVAVPGGTHGRPGRPWQVDGGLLWHFAEMQHKQRCTQYSVDTDVRRKRFHHISEAPNMVAP